MYSVLALTGSLVAILHISPVAAQDYCPVIEAQPIEYVYQQPILVSTYVPSPTDLVVDDGLTIPVTNAPTTVSTVVTDTSKSSTVVTRTRPGNDLYNTITQGYPGTTTRAITVPPGTDGGPGTVIIQTPDPTASTGPYATITSGYDGGVPTTAVTDPAGEGSTAVVPPDETTTVVVPPGETTTAVVPPDETTTVVVPPGETTTAVVPPGETTTAVVPPDETTTTAVVPPDETTTTAVVPPDETTTTTAAPTSTCVPVVVEPTPACFDGLPEACETLGDSNGLSLITLVPLCLVALGPYAVGDTATCLSTSGLGLGSVGSDIVDCLNQSLDGTCIDTLPEACTDLSSQTGLGLIPAVAQCVVQLGPFAVGSAAVCLSTSSITDSTSGQGIVDCLEEALGLSDPNQNPGGDSCAPTNPSETCVTQLPPDCDLADTNGLALIPALPICLTKLGAYGVGNAAQCLTTASITISTTGQQIVDCLLNAFAETCISSLPPACANLANDDTAQLALDIPVCIVALGPFAVGDALTCLSTSTGSGQDIVSCLNNAIFGNAGEVVGGTR